MFSLQPVLENNYLKLTPLSAHDFEKLYRTASDPLIWVQHPEHDRWKKKVFKTFFEQALLSEGAFLITDKATGEVAGTTRFYSYNEDENSIFIGFTFFARKFWGTQMNKEVKKLMLDYIFQFVDLVKFHAGKDNFRSRKALEKLGAVLKEDMQSASLIMGSPEKVEFWLTAERWRKIGS